MAETKNGSPWWAIGIIVTLIFPAIFGVMYANDRRYADADEKINEKIKTGDESVRIETTRNVQRLDDKLSKLNEKVDSIDDKLDEIRKDQAVIVRDSYKVSMDILKQLGEISRKVK